MRSEVIFFLQKNSFSLFAEFVEYGISFRVSNSILPNPLCPEEGECMLDFNVSDLLLPERSGIISLVGAGGKTSLMFQLAREIAARGQRVLTTTTTRIFSPTPEEARLTVITEDPLAWLRQTQNPFEENLHLTLARQTLAGNKLQGFPPETVDALWETGLFDWILVEADGAAGRPIKAPAAHEPVIPGRTDCAVAVLGLQGFGRPLDGRWYFRPAIFAELSGCREGDRVSLGDLARVLVHDQGIMKGTPAGAERALFLNQADDARQLGIGRRFLQVLEERYPGFFDRYAIGSLKKREVFNVGFASGRAET